MNKPVKVTANEAGQIVVVSKNNSDYGYVRVSQVRTVFEGSWARPKNISALISGLVADLKEMDLTKGEVMPGKIQIVESLEAFNADSPEKDEKVAGATGITCQLDGQPIYRKTFYTEDPLAGDTLIAHNNGDAIKAKHAEMKEAEEATL